MNNSIVSLLLIQIILIALNAVFASAELAVLSVNESKINRLAEPGSKKARRLRKLLKEPAKFLSTIQIAITLSGFLGSAFAADGFSDPLVDWLVGLGATLSRNTLDTLSVIFITLVLSYFTLIFGELVPKRIAMKKSEALALKVSGIVSGISVLFKPIVWLLSVSTNTVLRMLGIDPNETAEPQIKQIDCNTWEISGNAELDEIERAIGVTFDTEYINTFTGYIFDRLKGIPDDGQTNIELKLDNISVTIKETRDHPVVLAEIKRIDHSIEKETQK